MHTAAAAPAARAPTVALASVRDASELTTGDLPLAHTGMPSWFRSTSTSETPQPHMPGEILLKSYGHPSTQSGVPSMSVSTGRTPHPHIVGHVGAGTGDDDAGRLVEGGGVGVGALVDAGDPVVGAGVPGTGALVTGTLVVLGDLEVTGTPVVGEFVVTGEAEVTGAPVVAARAARKLTRGGAERTGRFCRRRRCRRKRESAFWRERLRLRHTPEVTAKA